jgi:hypothetical protein
VVQQRWLFVACFVFIGLVYCCDRLTTTTTATATAAAAGLMDGYLT